MSLRAARKGGTMSHRLDGCTGVGLDTEQELFDEEKACGLGHGA